MKKDGKWQFSARSRRRRRVMGTELSPSDDLEIEQLYARYAHAADTRNAAAWAGCFTRDGVFDAFGTQQKGREQLTAMMQAPARGAAGRHWISNLVLEPTDYGATGTAYFSFLAVANQPVNMPTTGMYNDELEHTAEGWRFRKRLFTPDR